MRLIPTKEAFSTISFGLLAIRQTSSGLKAAFKDRLKSKNKQIAAAKLNSARLLDAQNKQDKEAGIEALKSAGKNATKNPIASSIGGFWNRIISLVGSLLLAWVVDKIPQIIEAIKKFADQVKVVFSEVVLVYESIIGVVTEIGDVIQAAISDIKSGDLFTQESKLKKELEDLDKSLRTAHDTWNSSIQNIKSILWNYKDEGTKTSPIIIHENRIPSGYGVPGDLNTAKEGEDLSTDADNFEGVVIENTDGWSVDRIDQDNSPDQSGVNDTRNFTRIPVSGRTSIVPNAPLVLSNTETNLGMGTWNKVYDILIAPNGDIQIKERGGLVPGGNWMTTTVMETIDGEVVWHDHKFPHSHGALTDNIKQIWMNVITNSINEYMEANPDAIKLLPPSTVENLENQGAGLNTRSFMNISQDTGGRVIGYTGGAANHPGSGSSSGPHLHVEAGGGVGNFLGEARYLSADKVFPDILIDGKPLSSFATNSPPGYRIHPTRGGRVYHKGYDFPLPVGSKITLRQGSSLEFVDYDPGKYDPNGHGYNIVIQDKDTGEKYILSHLSAGPDPLTPSGEQNLSSMMKPVDIASLSLSDEAEGETILVPMPINSQVNTSTPSTPTKFIVLSDNKPNIMDIVQKMNRVYT